jgi:hypothetical protein
MRQALLALQTKKIKNEKKREAERTVNATVREKTGTASVSANEKGSVKESERGSETARTARRAGAVAGARERIITREPAHPLPPATRNVIMGKAVITQRGTILSFIKITPLVNNGQKMPPKIKITTRMIKQAL